MELIEAEDLYEKLQIVEHSNRYEHDIDQETPIAS